jgi:hypothetical protein
MILDITSAMSHLDSTVPVRSELVEGWASFDSSSGSLLRMYGYNKFMGNQQLDSNVMRFSELPVERHLWWERR